MAADTWWRIAAGSADRNSAIKRPTDEPVRAEDVCTETAAQLDKAQIMRDEAVALAIQA
jgi:hypothetical protein